MPETIFSPTIFRPARKYCGFTRSDDSPCNVRGRVYRTGTENGYPQIATLCTQHAEYLHYTADDALTGAERRRLMYASIPAPVAAMTDDDWEAVHDQQKPDDRRGRIDTPISIRYGSATRPPAFTRRWHLLEDDGRPTASVGGIGFFVTSATVDMEGRPTDDEY